jgi:hypothetical protein
MGVEKVPNTLAAGIKATGGEGEGGPRDGTLSGPPAAASVPPASGEHEGGEVREGSGILPSLSGIGGAGGELATQSRDTLALADVAAMDESARAYYANLGKMAVDRIEEALDDGLLDGGPKDHVANVAFLIPDGLDALIALARRNRGGGAGAGPPFDGKPCPMCPVEVRGLYGAAHNALDRFDDIFKRGYDGDSAWFKLREKMEELRAAVETVRPLADAHFINRQHSHGE